MTERNSIPVRVDKIEVPLDLVREALRLKYTAEAPTVAGYYWCKADLLSERICSFINHNDRVITIEFWAHIAGPSLRYAGPIARPVEETP